MQITKIPIGSAKFGINFNHAGGEESVNIPNPSWSIQQRAWFSCRDGGIHLISEGEVLEVTWVLSSLHEVYLIVVT